MLFDNRHMRIVLSAFFLFLLFLSLTIYFGSRPWIRRVLFFPQSGSARLVGEQRFLPPRRGIEKNIELYVQELILGPADPAHSRALPRKLRLLSVIEKQGRVYVSLSRDIFSTDASLLLDPTDALQVLANGLIYNFPRIRRLHLLVEGQVPGEQYADGFKFDKKKFR